MHTFLSNDVCEIHSLHARILVTRISPTSLRGTPYSSKMLSTVHPYDKDCYTCIFLELIASYLEILII